MTPGQALRLKAVLERASYFALGSFTAACTLVTLWAVHERQQPLSNPTTEEAATAWIDGATAMMRTCDSSKPIRVEVAGFVFRLSNCHVEREI